MTDPVPAAVAPRFVHLRVHSEFSLVDGLVRIRPLVARAVEYAMPAVAVTDLGNLFGLVRFFTTAEREGVKPIVGAELVVRFDDDDTRVRLVALVRNANGYLHLTRLVSLGYTRARQDGLPCIDASELAAEHEDLIVIAPMLDGPFARSLQRGDAAGATTRLGSLKAMLGDRLYLELTRTGRPAEAALETATLALAVACEVPVVATQDVRFLDTEDFEAHEARVCIHTGRTLGDPNRPRSYSAEQYFCSQEAMVERFADLPEALENSVEIARRCSLDLGLGTYYLPDFPVPEGETMEQFFRRLSQQGLEVRHAERIAAGAPPHDAATLRSYQERLEFEIGIILSMGYPGYFLIVQEFINWAKANDVPVGPGRGSGAGSLVAYALRITDLDPIEYDLLFERFLNPERVSMPDFDVDFCMDGRDRVIAHVADLYGNDAVSQIVTFGTMAAKAVVRDVARVLGKSYGLADRLAKLIPFEVGMTLEKAMAQEPDLVAFVQQDDDAGEVMDMAFKLEGVVRNIGKHAGGVVIAPGPLTNYVPVCADESGEGLMTQFDKDDVELAGLVKFDFLGLRTLTIIDWALEIVNAQRAEVGAAPLQIDQLPLDDPQVYQLLLSAETTAVFQLESHGMKKLIRQLKPDCFEDIIALVALFRPGPLESGMAAEFTKRKHGDAPVAYPVVENHFDELEPVLKNSYGVILYQEQVMQIAQVLGGFSLGGADLLRRAMGKKKMSEMTRLRKIFLEGAESRGHDRERANDLFDLMEKFAGYGFNKSHSAAYALVSYQTAYLKRHYPAAFMAAVLSADIQSTDKVVGLVEECRRLGLTVLPPDVNRSEFRFTVPDPTTIVYGLGAIKGVGEGPVAALVEARTGAGAFADLFDFCRRVDGRKANKKALEALICAGAMDALAPERDASGRARLLAGIEPALREADRLAANAQSGMSDLFGGADEQAATTPQVELPTAVPLREKDRLAREKEALGLYVSGHPINACEAELAHMEVTRIRDLRVGDERRVAGLVIAVRFSRTRRGDPIATITLDDRTGRIDVSLFGDALEAAREHLIIDTIAIVEGRVEDDEFSGSERIRAKALQPFEQSRVRFADALVVPVDAETADAEALCRELRAMLDPYRGRGCPVAIEVATASARGRVRLGDAWRVDPLDELIERLRDRFPATRIAYPVDVVH